MTIEGWKELKNFSATELDTSGRPLITDIEKISGVVMVLVDEWVSFLKETYKEREKIYCKVHCILTGKHAKDSYHKEGRAIDVHVNGLSLYEMAVSALMFGFRGVGFYVLDKENKKEEMRVYNPFVHLDIRPFKNMRATMWYREEGKYEYAPTKILARLSVEDCLQQFPY
jgi:hypothetical protein